MTLTEFLMDFYTSIQDQPKFVRLAYLVAASYQTADIVPGAVRVKVIRYKFKRLCKRKGLKYEINSVCFGCLERPSLVPDHYMIRHHIVAIKNGGGNRKLNIVSLCTICHAYVHPWLRLGVPMK